MVTNPVTQPLPSFGVLSLRPAQNVVSNTPLSSSSATVGILKRLAAAAPENHDAEPTSNMIKQSQHQTPTQVAISTDNPILQANGQPWPSFQPVQELMLLNDAARSHGLPENLNTLIFAMNARTSIIQQGGDGDKTPEDVIHYFMRGWYSARVIEDILISVEPHVVTNKTGKIPCDPKTYRADLCQTMRGLKNTASRDWKKHFCDCEVKMPPYDHNRITIHLAQSRGASLMLDVSCWQEVVTEQQYFHWFQENVVHGRARILSASLRYDVEDPLVGDDLFL